MITRELIEKANKGLPTVDIKGKNYVMVKDRVKAFRNTFPDMAIVTDVLHFDDESVTIKATILDENGMIKATGHAQEYKSASFINKTSYVENCETSAIGRAIGLLGIGIDDSFGSADEVANAIHQQDAMKRVITPAQAEGLKQLLEKTESDTKAFLKNFKVNSVDEIPADMYAKAQELMHKKVAEWQGR